MMGGKSELTRSSAGSGPRNQQGYQQVRPRGPYSALDGCVTIENSMLVGNSRGRGENRTHCFAS